MDKKSVDALYQLSPMQRGMLLHALHTHENDPGALHLRCTLTGAMDLSAFNCALAQVTQRHPVLRTVFRWKGLDEPLQIVLRTVEVPVAVEDLRALTPTEQQEHLAAYRDADRKRGIDLSQRPTSRLALFQTRDTVWDLIWSCHHALLDGWSGGLMLQETVALTNAIQLGVPVELASAAPFQEYIRWLSRQSEAEAEAFWRNELMGISDPTPIPLVPPDTGRSSAEARPQTKETSVKISAATLSALRETARRYQVTLSALLHGGWGLILSRISEEPKVLFGSTTSGRAIDLPGVEAIVGMLINTLPVRVEVTETASAMDVCRQVHASQSGRDRFAHSAPAQVHQWSEVPRHQRLYESLLVVENYPVSDEGDGPVRMGQLQGGITSSFPITVIANPGDMLYLHLIYDAKRFGGDAARQLLESFVQVLVRLSETPEMLAQELIGALALGKGMPVEVPAATPYARLGRKPLSMARTQTEQTLADIWEEVLNVSPIGVTDEFFEMGGDSISSLQIIARANEAGLTLKSSDFFEHPTIRELAKALDTLMPARPESHFVSLAPEGTQSPLFIIHGWGGKVFKYRALARRLGEDQPVFGIQDVEYDSPESRFQSFDAMIDQYVSVIRSRQPRGPYSFLGFSVGGTIAYAIALRFLASGETVSRLFVLDTVPYNLPRRIHAQVRRPFLIKRARHHALSLLRSPSQIVPRIRKLAGVARNEFGRPSEHQSDSAAVEVSDSEDYYRMLMRHYKPERCRIPVTLVLTTVYAEEYDFPPGWRYLTGPDLETFTIDTDHDGLILKTEIRNQVADIVRDRLENG